MNPWTSQQSIPLARRDSDSTGLVGKEGYGVTVDGSGDYSLAATNGTDFRGVCTAGGAAATDLCSAVVGYARGVAGAAVTEGDPLTLDSSSRFITATGTTTVVGVARQAAGAADEIIWIETVKQSIETLTLTAAAESTDTIAVTVATSVASLRAIAYTVDAVTGVPDVTTTDAYTVAETGGGTPVSPAAGGGAQLIFTCSAAGAAVLTVTDVAGGSDQDVHLVVIPLGHPGVPAKDIVLTFDAA